MMILSLLREYMKEPAMATAVINMVSAGEYALNSYGIVLKSETDHDFSGSGIHNRHHSHVLQIWDNTINQANRGLDYMIDPFGYPTSERYSYLWSAQATVITSHRGQPKKMGDVLKLGDKVELRVNGYVIGEFVVEAKPLHDPHLVRVDGSL